MSNNESKILKMQRSRKILPTIKRKMSQKKIDPEITKIMELVDNDFKAITRDEKYKI